MATVLEIRANALNETMERWKDRPFKLGKNDCVKLLLFELKLMGVAIPNSAKLTGYKTPLAGRAALKRVYGISTVPEFLDKFFDRIAPAMALPGDPISMPGYEDGTLGSIGLYVGNDIVFCYEEEHELPVAGRLSYDGDLRPAAAWRVLR